MLRCLKTFFILLFAMSQVMPAFRSALADTPEPALHKGVSGMLLAQYERGAYSRGVADSSEAVDVEPPLIEHDVIAEAEADIRQTFVATVADDQDLDSVLFYYRYAGETSFSRYVMTPVSYSSTYIAQIPTDPNSNKAIEYYIQARDTSGNRTVRGYTFSPLVRNIVPPSPAESVAQSNAQQATSDASAASAASRVPKAVYIVGGVLLLGLIASAAGSSGSGSGGDGCSTEGCRLSLTIDQPF